MKKYNSLFLIAVLSFGLSSCEDFFSTTLSIDPPEHKIQLAVHAYGNTSDNFLRVGVNETAGLLDDEFDTQNINDATVSLYLEDQLIYELDPVPLIGGIGYNYLMPTGQHIFQKGATYRLEVAADTFPTVMGETTIPLDVTPISVSFDSIANSGFEDDEYSAINVLFQDNPNADDYYEFFGLRSLDSISFFPFNSDCFDATVQYGIEYLISEDAAYNGDEKNIEILVNQISTEEAEESLYLSWRVTSEGHFLFNKTAAIQNDSDENPFSSPIQVFSNLENGIGIFSIVNESRIKVDTN